MNSSGNLGIPCDSLESRFEIQRVLDQVAGQPLQQAVNFAVLRAMQKAVYSPAEEGHYALATRRLLPLHLAHSPLSRPDDSSFDGGRSFAGNNRRRKSIA